jgi:hypothetical protein
MNPASRNVPDLLQCEPGLLIRSALPVAALTTASHSGAATRGSGLGTIMTITTITTPMAGTG